MTLEIDFLPFATGVGAGVESQTAWVSDVVVTNGFLTGIAPSNQVNKAIRQPSFVSAAIANYIANTISQNVLDNGNLLTFWSQFWQSLLNSNSFVDAGSTNALSVSAPNGLTFPAPIAGLQVVIEVKNTNTGPSTFNWMGTGSVAIRYPNLTALTGSELTAGGYSTLVFDGTYWQLLSLSPNFLLSKGFANRAVTLQSNYNVVSGDGGKNFSAGVAGLTVTISSSFIASNNGPVTFSGFNNSFTINLASGQIVGGLNTAGVTSLVIPLNGWISLEPDGSNLRVVSGDDSTVGAPNNLNVGNNLNVLGSINPSTVNGIVGTTLGDNANTGSIGEYVSSTVSQPGAVALTSSVNQVITQMTLTPGDWDVWATIVTQVSSGCSVVQLNGGSSLNGSIPSRTSGGLFYLILSSAGAQTGTNNIGGCFPCGTQRINITSTTTVYLVMSAIFTGGTVSGYGGIFARRAR